MSERDAYSEVGAAIRHAIACATAANCRLQDRRVLDAVIAEVSSYSRLEDRVSLAKIAELAGIRGKRPEREVARSLKRLRDAGAATYEPGVGKTRSKVGLPASEEGAGTRLPSNQRGVLGPASEEGAGTRREAGAGTRLPEKDHEKENEKTHLPIATSAIGGDIEQRITELAELEQAGEATPEQIAELDRLFWNFVNDDEAAA